MVVASERTNFQTSRRGWRPRRTSERRLAQDIAESIRAHGEHGVVKSAWDYTSRIEVIEAVERILTA
jgi:hypothetical protein